MDYPFLARIDSDCGFGTGVLVAPEFLLTCAHVVSAFNPLAPCDQDLQVLQPRLVVRFPPEIGLEIPQPDVLECTGDDLALLRLPSPLARPALQFYRAANAVLQSLDYRDRFVVGFDRPNGSKPTIVAFPDIVSFVTRGEREFPKQYQTEGGASPGMSGSPLLAPLRAGLVGLGTVFLGGLGAARSVLIGPDVILDFLQRHGVQAEFAGPLSGPQMLPRATSLSSLIKGQRLRRRMSAGDLASRLRVDEGTLVAWETGEAEIAERVHDVLWQTLIRGDTAAVEDWLRFIGTPDLLARAREWQSAEFICRMLLLGRLRGISSARSQRPRLPEGSLARIHLFVPAACQVLFIDAEDVTTVPRRYTLLGTNLMPTSIAAGDHILPQMSSVSVSGPKGVNCLIVLAAPACIVRPWGDLTSDPESRPLSESEQEALLNRHAALDPQQRWAALCEYEVC